MASPPRIRPPPGSSTDRLSTGQSKANQSVQGQRSGPAPPARSDCRFPRGPPGMYRQSTELPEVSPVDGPQTLGLALTRPIHRVPGQRPPTGPGLHPPATRPAPPTTAVSRPVPFHSTSSWAQSLPRPAREHRAADVQLDEGSRRLVASPHRVDQNGPQLP